MKIEHLAQQLRNDALQAGYDSGLINDQQPDQVTDGLAELAAGTMLGCTTTHELAAALLLMPAVRFAWEHTARWSAPLPSIEMRVGVHAL